MNTKIFQTNFCRKQAPLPVIQLAQTYLFPVQPFLRIPIDD